MAALDNRSAGLTPEPPGPMVYRLRVWEYLMRSWKPYFWSTLGESLGAPVLYLLALGIGMGSLINRNGTGVIGVPYLDFIAPALLTASALQVAMSESTFATYGRFKWQRTLWGITATPVSPAVAADAHVLFIGTRVLVSSITYYLVLLAFGAAGRPGRRPDDPDSAAVRVVLRSLGAGPDGQHSRRGRAGVQHPAAIRGAADDAVLGVVLPDHPAPVVGPLAGVLLPAVARQ